VIRTKPRLRWAPEMESDMMLRDINKKVQSDDGLAAQSGGFYGTSRRMTKLERMRQLAVVGGVFGGLSAIVPGCLAREIASEPPTTKTNVLLRVRQAPIDKIDLLLAIDNSASMADKQAFLAKAVPKLVDRLVTPRCPDGKASSAEGKCSGTDLPEFAPITDIHIAVITSSLGGFGGDAGGDKTDGLRLLKPPAGVKGAPGDYLGWFPNVKNNEGKTGPSNAYQNATELGAGVAKLVTQAGESGAGFEAQLESVYRFLIQPDPWASIDKGGALNGVDNEVLKQRKQFLRPDSLVSVIMLSDEDDSSVDPASVNGSGSAYMSSDFPRQGKYPDDWPESSKAGKALEAFGARDSKQGTGRTAARGTSACEDPSKINTPACQTCAFQYLPNCGGVFGKDAQACATMRADRNCQENGGYFGATEDPPNVRFHQMKRRFGVDPQYPIRRYINGFTGSTVPMRGGEHINSAYVTDLAAVDSTTVCTNPLFAKDLPEEATVDGDKPVNGDKWCQLQRSERDPGIVFYAIIGGVSPELVYGPKKADGTRGLVDSKGDPRALNGEEWKKIVGANPLEYDYAGQDPTMIQSRPIRKDGNAQPLQGDWDTDSLPLTDLQYACTFPLPQSLHRDASKGSGDCVPNSKAPVCNGGTQVRAKAFPTIRELTLAKQLGTQGIAASLCAEEVGDENSPNFGYNPAVNGIVDRLKNVLSAQCLPRSLSADADGAVQCLILETYPEDFNKNCADIGRTDPKPELLAKFREQQLASQACGKGQKRACNAGEDTTQRKVCQLSQINTKPGETCVNDDKNGWCYVKRTGDKNPAGKCTQGIVFTSEAVRSGKGAVVDLQCIDQSTYDTK
jgi:hypothetical protein